MADTDGLRVRDPEEFAREFLMGYVDLAISGTLEYRSFQSIYLGPWQEITEGLAPTGTRAFARDIHHQGPGAGTPMGRLVLAVSEEGVGLRTSHRRAGRRRSVPRVGDRFLLRGAGPRLEIVVEPYAGERRQALRGFGREVAHRFFQQFD